MNYCCAKLFYKYFCYNVAIIRGIIITLPIPNHSQYWQPKAPTFSPQLPLWGKNTDELLLCKIIL
jgi:hypothetical protein